MKLKLKTEILSNQKKEKITNNKKEKREREKKEKTERDRDNVYICVCMPGKKREKKKCVCV